MSPTAVTCLNVGDGIGVLPIVLLTFTTFARLKRLKPSIINSSRCADPNVTALEIRRSNVEVPHVWLRLSKQGKRPEFRPTPAGRSLMVVSLLLSAPVTMLNGGDVAYDHTQ